MSERTSLETHVDLCELRYEQLDARMSKVEQSVKELNRDVAALKAETQRGFSDIKDLIERKHGANQSAVIAAVSTVVVALIGFLGYLITHLPK
jgi:uncharacterized coiled-coil protein SlyX